MCLWYQRQRESSSVANIFYLSQSRGENKAIDNIQEFMYKCVHALRLF